MNLSHNSLTHSFIRVCLLLLTFSLFTLFSSTAFAADEGISTIGVKLAPNDYSSADNDIRFTPTFGQDYTFTATVTNDSDTEVNVKIYPSVGISTASSINYVDKNDNLLDDKYYLPQYVSVAPTSGEFEDNTLTIAANSSQDVTITINVPTELTGELLGGINFAQVIDYQENKDSVNIQQVYEKVMAIRLDLSKLADKAPQTYDDFTFNATNTSINLAYNDYNPNTVLVYADAGSYKLINPDNKVIAEGQFEEEKTILTPMTKTQLSVPLSDGVELISGEYQFIINIDGKENISKFNYTKKELDNFVKENQQISTVNVKSNNTALIIALVAVVIIVVILLIAIAKLYVKNKPKS